MRKDNFVVRIFFALYFSLSILYCYGQEEKHPVDGWSINANKLLGEVSIAGGKDAEVGFSYGFQKIQLFHLYKTKNRIIEIMPGIAYSFYPGNMANIKLRAGYTFGIPLMAGMQYNYYTDFAHQRLRSFEALTGFSKITPYDKLFYYKKLLLGYHFSTYKKGDPSIFPLRLHLIFGLK